MLNIKNRETEQVVRKRAARLGLNLTEAITVAVHHELQRLDAAQSDNDAGYLRPLREAAQQVRAVSDPRGWLSEAALFDEDGLPR